jgi:hypothetical protein
MSKRIAILAHELQHAVEVADAPSTTDQVGMVRLYQRIGPRNAGDQAHCFDSAAAIATGQLIQREARARSAEFSSR